jgi:hypothetical protein
MIEVAEDIVEAADRTQSLKFPIATTLLLFCGVRIML